MNENYKNSINGLKLYLKVVKEIPSEKQWNKYAKTEKLLSSKSLSYLCGAKFNKICSAIIKKSNKI